MNLQSIDRKSYKSLHIKNIKRLTTILITKKMQIKKDLQCLIILF